MENAIYTAILLHPWDLASCITGIQLMEWFDWLVPLQAFNYHHAFHLYHVLFSIKPECSAEQLLAVDPSYCSLYPSRQVINHFMLLHAFTVFYFPTWNFKQVLLVDSSAHVLAD